MNKLVDKSIVVKEPDIDELENVRRLLVESYRQYEENIEPEAWTKYLNDIIASVDNPNIDKILVAKHNNEILGSLQLFQSSEKAYGRPELEITSPIVRLLCVHPNARGLGIATALLNAAILYAKNLDALHLYLHSAEWMEKAIRLYEYHGFKQDQTKEYSKNGFIVKCFRFDI